MDSSSLPHSQTVIIEMAHIWYRSIQSDAACVALRSVFHANTYFNDPAFYDCKEVRYLVASAGIARNGILKLSTIVWPLNGTHRTFYGT